MKLFSSQLLIKSTKWKNTLSVGLIGDPSALTAEAGLLAVDEVEASVLLLQG